ncbi:MAG: hypothetical protein KIT18_09375 [Burkholderiales bacterium]|nr:hypothetical protein [Burkholderiales bacterium]
MASQTESSGNLPITEYRRFESLREYEALIDELIPQTQRAIRIFDRSLSRAYNSPQRYESLRQFLLASRANRLTIILHDTATIERDCPRMMGLLTQFSHAMSIRQTLRVARQVYDPFAIFDASHYVHRFHYDHMRAAAGRHDVNGAQLLLDRFAEIFEASVPAVSASVSGL